MDENEYKDFLKESGYSKKEIFWEINRDKISAWTYIILGAISGIFLAIGLNADKIF